MKDRLNAITALLAVIAFMLTVLVIQNTFESVSIKIDHKKKSHMGYYKQIPSKEDSRPSNPIAKGRICPLINNDGTLLLIDEKEIANMPDNSNLIGFDDRYCMPMGTPVESNPITNLPGNIEDMPTINNDYLGQPDTSVGGSAGSASGGTMMNPKTARL